MEYVVVFERGESSYGAYVPDLPGCVAVGETKEEATELIRAAISMHLEAMREDGLPIPGDPPRFHCRVHQGLTRLRIPICLVGT
jgi:predicted RNase H-like HicB family nuclease